METTAILWYFADPMCSWCWGFSPVLDKIKETYGEKLKVSLMLGGLRPGTVEAMTPQLRKEIFHHWYEVIKLTGQKFSFDHAMPDGFVYDTEPPCRAVIVVAEFNPDMTLPYFKSIQEAFYIKQKNVCDEEVLAQLAGQCGMARDNFLDRFHAADVRQKTQQHFQHTRQAEVRGFPTLVLQNGSKFTMIASGYRPFDELRQDIDSWLQDHA